MLASIHAQGTASSQMVVNLIAMDAGAVSRSMSKLAAEGYVSPKAGRFIGRTKPYELTAEGRELYDRLLATALEREDLLLAGLSDQEREQLLSLMRKVIDQIDKL
ncbi:DNA-binding MarR family transcriptional regulator [Sphingobium sp. B2D3A]|uniref:MarR family winged helix-turn-helix transcriptional regulator n=1 Tax=unclassified Sphingobium TaxID=2611147 RepID=UPI0022248DFF|nr:MULTISPECIES: hypothetical protein [unclassified Sphingobium]MCW2338882.1 DNA-binding MarR family transcriptional regulator [Sphingobium sp. B2D3A]MCW2385307.1 DNA-binding MarR family transcriptional regulator [Sphingobium sp. B2D3D]MCW2387310.1 DNA-binding MarR family transcriptional regulator [Sphingobium sp. B11D3B]